jgi:hypothetical protein
MINGSAAVLRCPYPDRGEIPATTFSPTHAIQCARGRASLAGAQVGMSVPPAPDRFLIADNDDRPVSLTLPH